ncbi:MAG: hypothetical protein QXT87_05265 [Thermoproteota archaeon]
MRYMAWRAAERGILLILMWSLILEILTLAYYISSSQTHRFEFGMTLFLILITLPPILWIIRSIAKRARPLEE